MKKLMEQFPEISKGQRKSLNELLSKAMLDPEFRFRLLNDPVSAAKELKIELADDKKRALLKKKKKIEKAGKKLERWVSRTASRFLPPPPLQR